MPYVMSQAEVDDLLNSVEKIGVRPSKIFPISARLLAIINDTRKQIGKLDAKRGMLLRQIETLKDAMEALKASEDDAP